MSLSHLFMQLTGAFCTCPCTVSYMPFLFDDRLLLLIPSLMARCVRQHTAYDELRMKGHLISMVRVSVSTQAQ